MNAADAKKPKFNSEWWKKNKAKAADGDGGIALALAIYAKKTDEFLRDSKLGKNPHLADVVAALEVLQKRAAKAKSDPKLGAQQKETKEALANYEKLSTAAVAECKKVLASPVLKANAIQLVKGAEPLFQQWCKIGFVTENYDFLALMAKNVKKDRHLYDEFLSDDAKRQVNISGDTRKKFEQIDKAVAGGAPDAPETWAEGPWSDAVQEVGNMFGTDVLPRFRFFALGEMLKAKLPATKA